LLQPHLIIPAITITATTATTATTTLRGDNVISYKDVCLAISTAATILQLLLTKRFNVHMYSCFLCIYLIDNFQFLHGIILMFLQLHMCVI
jgi:hypothetical protein